MLQSCACSSVFKSQRRDLCIKQTGMIPAWVRNWLFLVALALATPGGFLIFNHAFSFSPCSPAPPEWVPHLWQQEHLQHGAALLALLQRIICGQSVESVRKHGGWERA